MIKRSYLFSFLIASAVCAQESSMRATMNGRPGDHNKCTIEVNVDDVAEVEISGDMARVRTLSGQPAQFRRFQCSDRLPRRPSDFKFTGIDGRGRVDLVRDPRDNGGIAVVRIEDPKSGREGYTFDLEWQGGSDARDQRQGDRPGDRRDGDRRDDGSYRSDRDQRDGRRSEPVTVTCSSDDMRRHYCDADTRGSVRMVRQRSDAACRQDSTWGYDRRGIWVDRGCRADFEVGR